MAKQGNKKNKAFSWDYAPALESTGHVHIKEKYDLFIDGKFVKPSSCKLYLLLMCIVFSQSLQLYWCLM